MCAHSKSSAFINGSWALLYILTRHNVFISKCLLFTSTGIDADASKGETSPGYFNSKLVYCYKCVILIAARTTLFLHYGTVWEGTLTGFPHSGTFSPREFPEVSLAYSHISLKGPRRSIIYGKIFWPPHTPSPYSQPGLQLPSKLTILWFSVFLSFQYLFLKMQVIFVTNDL